MTDRRYEGLNQRGVLTEDGVVVKDPLGRTIPVPRLCDRGCPEDATYGFRGSWLCTQCYCSALAREERDDG